MKLLSSRAPLLTALSLMITFAISSCKKETSQTLSPQDEQQANVTATESDAEAENVFNGIFDDAMGVNKDVAIGGTGLFMRNAAGNYQGSGADERSDNIQIPPCLNVTIATSGNTAAPFPITITLDFGSGCTAADYHLRKGKIIITYSDRLLNPGATANLRFQDFYIDSIYVDNSTSYTISNTGTADRSQFTIDIHGRLSKTSGNYTEWYSHKLITRTEGGITPTPQDDVMEIEGNASGKCKRSDLATAWKAEITIPLIKSFICHWISKGTVKVGRENLSSSSQWIGTLDYGTGNCDNRATLTLNGVTYQITLH